MIARRRQVVPTRDSNNILDIQFIRLSLGRRGLRLLGRKGYVCARNTPLGPRAHYIFKERIIFH